MCELVEAVMVMSTFMVLWPARNEAILMLASRQEPIWNHKTTLQVFYDKNCGTRVAGGN